MNVVFADEIAILAQQWKQFEYSLDCCEKKWLSNLIKLHPDLFHWM